MKNFKRIIIAAALFFYAGSANAGTPESFADLADKLTPSVVNISSTQHIKHKESPNAESSPFKDLPPGTPLEEFKDFFDKFYRQYGDDEFSEKSTTSLGSGFVISPEGYIVTNYHVIDQAEEVNVTFSDDSKYKAEIVGRDSKTDLALLKIKPDKKLPYVTFGDSDKARVGDWVLAIGNPFGLGGTVTAGIISARARDINSGPFDDFIQTDAAINRGNSGGPMFNVNGDVVGINTAIYSPSGGSVGIGFAVPANLAQPIIEQLKKEGKIQRAWLGVKIQNVTDEIAESVGLKKAHGALVVDVSKESPAGKGGIEPGDIVTKFDGKEVPSMKKLPRFVAETKIGKEVDVEVWRSGKTKELSVKLGELKESEEKDEKETSENKPELPEGKEVLGLRVTPLTAELKQVYRINREIAGLLITDVKRGSDASKHGIKRGDVILLVNQRKAGSFDELKAILKDAKTSGRKSILAQVYRNGETIFVALPVNEE